MKTNFADKTRSLRDFPVWLATKILTPNLHKTLFHIEVRPMTQYLKHHFAGSNLIGAEIGVLSGKNALSFLQNLSIIYLYLIDPYLPYIDGNGKSTHTVKFKAIAQKRLRKYTDKTSFLYVPSLLGVKKIADGSLDFAYIDADHNYAAAKMDIAAWFPKVKNGGVLGGHDISWNGVFWAVAEFATDENLKLHVCDVDWWVVKGKEVKAK